MPLDQRHQIVCRYITNPDVKKEEKKEKAISHGLETQFTSVNPEMSFTLPSSFSIIHIHTILKGFLSYDEKNYFKLKLTKENKKQNYINYTFFFHKYQINEKYFFINI